MRTSFTVFDCAESALFVDFGPQYNKALSLSILDISERLANTPLPGLMESVPALTSLTVFYDPLQLPRERLVAEIQILFDMERLMAGSGRYWEIPAVYGGKGGPDLADVARRAGLTDAEAIEVHASKTYHVYMLGFLPGFAYLGDLPGELRIPRRATPRARVPAGSVAIAADMTAIYPLESPGGWHLIGFTPVVLWDIGKQKEPLLRPGDEVRFVPVSESGARRLTAGGWQPSPTGPA